MLAFYPHSSQMKNTPFICIYTTQFSQNMLCCVISIFVSVQCVFFLWAFFNSFHHIPPTFQELLRKSLNTLNNFLFSFFLSFKVFYVLKLQQSAFSLTNISWKRKALSHLCFLVPTRIIGWLFQKLLFQIVRGRLDLI